MVPTRKGPDAWPAFHDSVDIHPVKDRLQVESDDLITHTYKVA